MQLQKVFSLIKLFIILIVLILLNFSLGMGVEDILITLITNLLTGWKNFIFYFEKANINFNLIKEWSVFFILFIIATHYFCCWFYQHLRQKTWQLHWTVTGCLLLLCAFLISISGIIIIHNIIWLKRDPMIISNWGVFPKINKIVNPIKEIITNSYKHNTQNIDKEIWKKGIPNQTVLQKNFLKTIEIEENGTIAVSFADEVSFWTGMSMRFIPVIENYQIVQWNCDTPIIPYSRHVGFDCVPKQEFGQF
jgi:hypothetical protein